VRVEDSEGRVADEATYDEADAEVGRAAGTGRSLHRVGIAKAAAAAGIWKAAKPTPGVAPAGE
jgi:hypothetical protein